MNLRGRDETSVSSDLTTKDNDLGSKPRAYVDPNISLNLA